MTWRRLSTRWWVAPILSGLLLLLAACGTTESTGMDHSGMTMTAGPTPGTGTMPGMGNDGMPMDMTTMPMSPTGMLSLTEVQFIDGMIPHHRGAIMMATEALTQTKRPEIRQLATAIIAAQEPEITQLQAWRTQWYPNEAATDDEMLATMGMGSMGIGMDPLKEFDQRFLEAMIAHHQGAVQMAASLLTTATHPELRTFADQVISNQTAEIKQMQAWLTAWYGQ